VWIGSRVYPAILIQALEAATNEPARAQIVELLARASFYNQSILVGLRLGVLGLSGVLIWIVATGRSRYPRWFAMLNPIFQSVPENDFI